MTRLAATSLACLVALVAPAFADWRFDPGLGGSGYAVGEGSNDIGMVLDCGNGGLPAVSIEGHDPGADTEIFVISVTGHPEELWSASCDRASCLLDLESMERARRFLGQVRSGSEAQIGLYRRGSLSVMSLRGSGRAMAASVDRACPL